MLKIGDQVGIVACSNRLNVEAKEKVEQLIDTLKGMGIKPICSPYLFDEGEKITGKSKAEILMAFYKDKAIKVIFDISGGDRANEVLTYLDYQVLQDHPKPFWGYSDLTTIINAVFTQTQQPGYLYQIRNLVGEQSEMQKQRVRAALFKGKTDLWDINYHFVQGDYMEGTVVGGNIRCFLKLAGTPFMPDFNDKILLLEARGGKEAQIVTYLHQLHQMNVFSKVKGVLLGTFTEMQQIKEQRSVELLLQELVGHNLPIAKTMEVGHGSDSKAIIIGKKLVLDKDKTSTQN